MNRALLFFATCFLALSALSQAGEVASPQPLFTVLFTAESHGALFPCDCPLQPLGGIARRARLDDKGEIVHILEPEYHGDPLDRQGVAVRPAQRPGPARCRPRPGHAR